MSLSPYSKGGCPTLKNGKEGHYLKRKVHMPSLASMKYLINTPNDQRIKDMAVNDRPRAYGCRRGRIPLGS